MTTAVAPATPSPCHAPPAPRATAVRARVTALMTAVHDDLTALFATLDEGGGFAEERWTRAGGGGGVSRTLSDGVTFEKAGINRSVVHGALGREAAARIGGRRPAGDDATFFAAGVSLVVHPRSPMIPTVHLNVRYFEVAGADGAPADAWVGGGTDLTPTYPYADDVRDFHRALRRRCDWYHPSLYPRFKRDCDAYFTNAHRGGEPRGVGGIFFDHLRAGEEGTPDADALLALLGDVGRSPATSYAPIVRRRRGAAYGTRERAFQLARRGRYVEFNLLHDRGTHFGLQTGARTESVLMSLPPMATWGAARATPYAPDSFEARLLAMLAPRDWAGDEDGTGHADA